MIENYAVHKQHNKQKYHAIERILLLLDDGSFCEIGCGMDSCGHNQNPAIPSAPYDGVITGRGTVGGKTVFVFAQDFTVSGGSIGLNHGKKIAKIIAQAVAAKCPVVGIYDSGGARIGEGLNALAGCGEMLCQNAKASGIIPQISVIVGPCAGAAAYSPALSDFVFMVEKIGQMYITGSQVIASVTGEHCDLQELGGAKMHNSLSGSAHFCCSSEKKCFAQVRSLLSILPSSYDVKPSLQDVRFQPAEDDIDGMIPLDDKQPYSMPALIAKIADESSVIEVHQHFAPSMVTAFAKICGVTVGVVANNPMINSGCIDRDSSDKAARFVRFCDAFNIPILTLVDTPGYLPGVSEEHGGIIRHGAKLLYAYTEANTPLITVVLRKAFGGAYIAMGSKQLGADYVYACPNATLAVMGAEGAVSILYRKQLAELPAENAAARKEELIEEYTNQYMNTRIAEQEGYVDAVIKPSQIRRRVFEDILALRHKESALPNRKHGNIPL